MSLQFVIRVNKKSPARIEVLRSILEDGKKTSRHQTLGSFKSLDQESIDAFKENVVLDEYELYQLENYLAHLRFNKHAFNVEPEAIEREFIYFAPVYEEALFKLWKLAKAFNVPFLPAEIQQEVLLRKAKSVERKINQLAGKQINILESIGVDIRPLEEEEYQKRVVDSMADKLFKTLLKTGRPLSEISDDFMKIAASYGKSIFIKPHYIKAYAISERRRLPLWYCTIAIDLLTQYGIDPLGVIGSVKTAEHWVRLRKAKMSETQAIQSFCQSFQIDPDSQEEVKAIIKSQYKQGMLIDE